MNEIPKTPGAALVTIKLGYIACKSTVARANHEHRNNEIPSNNTRRNVKRDINNNQVQNEEPQNVPATGMPPRPVLYLRPQITGYDSFRLRWDMKLKPYHSQIGKYEIYACVQRLSSSFISPWKKITELVPPFTNGLCRSYTKSMHGFDGGFRYQIAVRGVDVFQRAGPFSQAVSVVLPSLLSPNTKNISLFQGKKPGDYLLRYQDIISAKEQ